MKKVVFAVEDDEDIRQLYEIALDSAGFDIECFATANDMFLRLEKELPDIFLLDIMLEGLDGYQILDYLKSIEKTKNIPVIMVSAKNQEISKVKALNAGSDDYICKPFGVMELVARINANLRKYEKVVENVEPTKLSYKDIIVDDTIHSILINDLPVSMPLKMYDLLRYFVINNDKLLTREAIFEKVWGTTACLETRTMDMHISALRKLLLENNSTCSIDTIRGVGYILK